MENKELNESFKLNEDIFLESYIQELNRMSESERNDRLADLEESLYYKLCEKVSAIKDATMSVENYKKIKEDLAKFKDDLDEAIKDLDRSDNEKLLDKLIEFQSTAERLLGELNSEEVKSLVQFGVDTAKEQAAQQQANANGGTN